MEILNNIPIKEIIGTIITVVSVIWAWFEKNKDKIQAIVIRVEKDSQDGWTASEKEQLAVDIFFQEVYPILPFYLKLIPKVLIEKMIRKIIKQICDKAHDLKIKNGLKPFVLNK